MISGVANLLAQANVDDQTVLMAALLHDIVEDTDTSFDEIEENFGKAVRDIVAEVTDDRSLSQAERKRAQIEHVKHASREAKLIKLADKLYNLRDMERATPKNWTQVSFSLLNNSSLLSDIHGKWNIFRNAYKLTLHGPKK